MKPIKNYFSLFSGIGGFEHGVTTNVVEAIMRRMMQ